MNKINNKLMVLLIMSVLVSGALLPLKTYAQSYTSYGGTNTYYDNSFVPGNANYYNNNYGYNNSGVSNPKPVVFSLNPSSLNKGSGATMVAITGNYFVPGAIAKWNGADRVTTYINSTYLQMQLTNDDMNVLGDFLVTVYNPTPGGGFSNAGALTIHGMQTNGVITPAPVVNTPNSPVATANKSNTVAKTVKPVNENDNMTASAVLGSGNFIPSNLIQWLVFFILVLLAIILWRKIYLNDKAAPLKHE